MDQTSKEIEPIKKRLLTAQSRQNNYTDKRKRALRFDVGDYVFVTPRFGQVTSMAHGSTPVMTPI